MRCLLILSIAMLFPVVLFSQSWQDVGGGTNNSSHALLTWDGKLVNLGSFNNPCTRVGLWDGTSWSCITSTMGQVGRAGVVWNGKLVVVGDFWNTQQPCVGCNGVAMWDDVNMVWTPLGNGVNNDVLCCTVFNGDLIIGGDFTQASGVPSSRVVRYNELTDTWESIGATTDFDNDVRCMTVFDGELWVGGDFNNVGGNPPSDGVVKWDESAGQWVGGNSGVDIVGGVNETIRVLYVNPNDGNLYMGGHFTQLQDGDAAAPDPNMSGIAMYDGSNWYPLGTGLNEYCRAIHEYNGNLIAGGYFTTAGGVSANKIAKWNGSTWSAMGQGFDANGIDEYVKSATVWNGIFFAGGAYTQAEGNPMNYIAQWYEAPSNPPVAAINSSASSVCAGSCINFSDNSTNSPTSWNWSFPGSSLPTSTDQNPSNVCYAAAGNYTVTLQACNASGCDNTTMNITVGTMPSVTANDASVCTGTSATLTATPSISGGTYLWSPGGETTQNITVSPGSSTTYSVEYTVNGCTSTPAVSTVTVTPAPTVSVNNQTICVGQSTTLTATPSAGGGTYFWTPGGQTSASISVTPGSTASWQVEYSLNGCSDTQSGTVTVNPTYSQSENISVCGYSAITYPDGFFETVSANTSHTSMLTSTAGCDSIIVTNVTVFPIYSLSENVDVCNGTTYTFPDGSSQTITANTSYTSNLTSNNGCDSTIVTNVSMVSNYTTSETVEICSGDNYTYPDGTVSSNITSNESHVSSLFSSGGCDSTVTTFINVNPMPDNNTSVTDNIITADQNGATYQWLDCNNGFTQITGETAQSYAPTANGSYAVQVSLNGCVDSSACITINTIGLDEAGAPNMLITYPNPVDESLQLSGSDLPSVNYRILDTRGRLILQGSVGMEEKIPVGTLAPGSYTLEVNQGLLGRYRFVKQ